MQEFSRQSQNDATHAPGSRNGDDSPEPSHTVKGDPAPVTHVDEKIASKSKYEASEPYRSRKGDRFSSF